MSSSSSQQRSQSSSNQAALVHIALIIANSIFGLGSIVGALGLHKGTNPLSFTFIREISSGIILWSLAYYFTNAETTSATTIATSSATITMTTTTTTTTTSAIDAIAKERQQGDDDETQPLLETTTPTTSSASSSNSSSLLYPHSIQHFKHFSILGLLLFMNQSCYIIGIQLGGPVTGSIWQPSTPIFTSLISMSLLKLEKININRIIGVVVAFIGCTIMILIGNKQRQHDITHGGTISFIIGNILFCCNCVATSFYILFSKPLLKIYPSLIVTSWSYLLGSSFMLLAAYISSRFVQLQTIICPLCVIDNDNDGSNPLLSFLTIPKETIPALLYYIVFQSVTSWGLILWSNQYATGTLVMGYTVLQPLTSLIFTLLTLFVIHLVPECSTLIVDSGNFDDIDNDDDALTIISQGDDNDQQQQQCLNAPGIGTLCGIVGVACGLSLIIKTEPKSTKSKTSKQDTANRDSNDDHSKW